MTFVTPAPHAAVVLAAAVPPVPATLGPGVSLPAAVPVVSLLAHR